MQNQCRACFVAFSSPAELRAHSESFRQKVVVLTSKIQGLVPLEADDDTNEDANVCPFCSEYFQLQEDLDDHIWAHQGELCELSERIKAAVWHLPFINDGAEHKHEATRDNYEESRCPFPRCQTSMAQKCQLRRHYNIHTTCYELCVGCRRQFSSVSAYHAHQPCSQVTGDAAKASFVKHRTNQLSALASQDFEARVEGKAIGRKRTQNSMQRINRAKRQRRPAIARDPAPQPDPAPAPDPGPDPNLATHTGVDYSLVNRNHSVQMFPTPPPSIGFETGQDPLLSDAYPQPAFPECVGLFDTTALADLMFLGYTIPFKPPAVYPGASVSDVVEESAPKDNLGGYFMS